MKKLLAISLPIALSGCGILFGSDFTIDFTVQVQSVQQVGGQTVCDVVISATANGDEGDRGRWGESEWRFRNISDGQVGFTDTQSAAFMAAQFLVDDILAGETLTTGVIQRSRDQPFEWEFSFNYRKPDSFRETAETSVTCS